MIVLNKLSKVCRDNALASGRVRDNSNPRAFLLQASRALLHSYDCPDFPSIALPQWTAKEAALGEVVCWTLAALEQLGCRNTELLLRDITEYRERYPDTARGDNL
ncbi:MAG: hypothetical protein LIO91_10395 [Bacteroidales bacterium]|nr:hypothetical protein [Bacteroidales bacterium]